MEIVRERNSRIGLVISIVFHIVLLLLFAIFGLTYMDPPPEEEGITINFGTSDDGMFNEQNNIPSEENVVNPAETNISEPQPTESLEENILTQSTEDAPSIDNKEEEKKDIVEPIEKKEEPKPDAQATNALNKWKANQAQSGGDGETGTPGDQGDINGDPNSTNYTGGGFGNGTSFTLSGRNMLSSPQINDNSQDDGQVVVDIIVDKYGKVLRATPGARGSTTTSTVLYKKAREAALKSKFNANPDAAEEQKGQMTFIFILN